MKPAYIRRGSLLNGIPKDELTVATKESFDELLDKCPLFWDAMLPKEAAPFLDACNLTGHDEAGYLRVSVLSHERASEIVDKWKEILKELEEA